MKSDNPFAKSESIDIDASVDWKINKKEGQAIKTVSDSNGVFYHLMFDNRQLRLSISNDEANADPKSFGQLEVKDVQIDGVQSPLFKWCLSNQDRHSRFLQQGLTVKKNICQINGDEGEFIMRLSKDMLTSLQNGSNLLIMLKPFRTPLELNYVLTDFSAMHTSLNAKPAAVAASPAAVAATKTAPVPKKTCKANPPAEYKNIKAVDYICDDAASKITAETKVAKMVDQEKAQQKKLAAEKEKQRKLAEEKKQQELALKLEQEQLLAAEAAAIAASEAKQAQINNEITQKMVKVCEKYWNKGEHRCYCEKYIEFAPSSIQASSTCK